MQEQHRNLEEMREMSASRGSMSLLDLSNVGVIDELPSSSVQATSVALASKTPAAKQINFSNVSFYDIVYS